MVAKQIFERARLPTEVLGRIWNLSDSQGRGALDSTEFVIAMHLLASYKSGAMRGVPNTLPAGLYEAASRRQPQRVGTGSRPGSGAPPAGIPPQFSGFSNARPQSPITRNQVRTPLSAQSTGDGWSVTPADKARFDQIFATLDTSNRGYITGDQAVEFFGNARLPEETLAQIWDLSDINSEGQLDRDEFAVAMFLIRQQRGTKDGRGIIPQSLPPALVPPSKRRQQIAPSQPTAPAFENAQVTQPRSAADDLFGLDVSAPAASSQLPQPTGGSMGSPFAASRSTPQPTSPAATFKPFVPSSSFGQSIIPQGTGSSAAQQSRSVPGQNPVSNDLLEDTDPEVSRNLTSETSELANLSNQVGNLSKQTTEIQGTRAQVQQQLSQNTQQKREFESRLTQLRSLYEQEVKEVKALQDQLAASNADTKRLQQEMAMINGSHQDLSSQHQQVTVALQSDQRENATLKDKMRQINAEVEQLKPQLEKLKYDARQQKGLVAINKKQLETNEAERDRIQSEMKAAAEEHEAAEREAAEHARLVEASNKELEEARNAPQPVARSIEPVVSPTPSTSSNPFFRRNNTNSESTFSPFSPSSPEPAPPVDTRQQNFDSIFGPSFAAGSPAGAAPATSFGGELPAAHREVSSSHTDASSVGDVAEPPAVHPAVQMTSAALPFRTPLDRADSITSSTRVAPSASRLSPADTPRALTPIGAASSPFSNARAAEDSDDSYERVSTPRQTSPPTLSAPNAEALEPKSESDVFGPATSEMGVPGAFPETATPEPEASHSTASSTAIAFGAGGATLAAGAAIAAASTRHEDTEEKSSKEVEPQATESAKDTNFDDIFGGPAHQRTPSQQVADFDSAFAGMNKPQANGVPKPANDEFPAIKEFDDDDSDDSEPPLGFDDDFNSKSPPRPGKISEESNVSAGKQPEVASALPVHLDVPRPGLATASSTASSLPGIDSQAPPPTYHDAVPDEDPSGFPQEYKGLLPSREDPTSPPLPTAGGSTNPIVPPSGQPQNYGPGVESPRGVNESKVADSGKGKASPFDFDSAFAGMGEAPAEEDSEDDDADTSLATRSHAHEFDPTFDSPAQSRSTTAASNFQPTGPPSIYSPVTKGPSQLTPQTGNAATNDFYKFNDSSPSAPRKAASIQTPTATGSTVAASGSHDWDSLFAGISAPPPSTGFPGSSSGVEESRDFGAPPTKVTSHATAAQVIPTPSPPTETPPTASQPAPERPKLGRALTEGTEHDDPILKRLTAMGWSRDESLKALEQFDYNIDKVCGP